MDLTSGYPFWQVRDGLPAVYPALDRHLEADVAIVGGGVTGALIASHLVEAGFATVLVDRREIGWGSTAATTALLQYELDTSLAELTASVGAGRAARVYRACHGALASLHALAARTPDGSDFVPRPSLYLASTRQDAAEFEREWAFRREIGLNVDLLSRAELGAQFGIERRVRLRDPGAAAAAGRDAAEHVCLRERTTEARCVLAPAGSHLGIRPAVPLSPYDGRRSGDCGRRGRRVLQRPGAGPVAQAENGYAPASRAAPAASPSARAGVRLDRHVRRDGGRASIYRGTPAVARCPGSVLLRRERYSVRDTGGGDHHGDGPRRPPSRRRAVQLRTPDGPTAGASPASAASASPLSRYTVQSLIGPAPRLW